MPYNNISCNILLIDDHKSDVDQIRGAIEKKDSKTGLIVARDGQEALAYLRQWEQAPPAPLIIVLDLRLPKIDGLAVLQTLKAHPRYRVIPVIVMTSSGEGQDILQAYKLGANSYVLKMTDPAEFANAILQIHHYWCELNIYPE